MEIINEAVDKFKDKQGELCGFLFDMLREINALEREFVAYSILEMESKPALKQELQRSINSIEMEKLPVIKELDTKHGWKDLRERYGAIVRDKCTEKLLAKPYGQSHYSGITYAFADEDFEGGTLIFKMNKPKRADIEVLYKRKRQDCGNRFTLVQQDGQWLVDAHNWMTDYDNIWHRGHI